MAIVKCIIITMTAQHILLGRHQKFFWHGLGIMFSNSMTTDANIASYLGEKQKFSVCTDVYVT